MSALLQLKGVQLNVKVRRPTNPELKKKGGEPKERVIAKGYLPIFHMSQKRWFNNHRFFIAYLP
ncbi:MAG: hypothetical protein ACI4WY_07260 [Anaerovoracaceae bacterium]